MIVNVYVYTLDDALHAEKQSLMKLALPFDHVHAHPKSEFSDFIHTFIFDNSGIIRHGPGGRFHPLAYREFHVLDNPRSLKEVALMITSLTRGSQGILAALRTTP